MPRLPTHPLPWLSALFCWLAVLWFLSSRSSLGGGPEIPHLDKIAHFSYFFGGGFVLCGSLLSLRDRSPDWQVLIPTTLIAMALIGWLDEWHQTFTPGRNGGDFWDWLADVAGGLAGALAFKAIHARRK
jgi:VanZ family protein